jgi:hypothetical protein
MPAAVAPIVLCIGRGIDMAAPDVSTHDRAEPANSTTQDETFPPVADGDPAAHPPVPLDDMPVPPLTEPTDVNGG